MTARATIVVGVDGSDCSRAALEFALDEAVRRDAAVDVVLAMPEVDFWLIGYAMSPALVEELSADLEKMGRDMVDTVLREGGGYRGDVPVRVRALGGAPGRVLVEQSHDADLLVVGHRGRGDSAAPCSGRSACSACCTPPSPSRSSGRGNQPPPWTATPKPGP